MKPGVNRVDHPTPVAHVATTPAGPAAGLAERARHERFQRQLVAFPWEPGADEGGAPQEPAALPADGLEARRDEGSPGDGEGDAAPQDESPRDAPPALPPEAPGPPAGQPAALPPGWRPGSVGGDGDGRPGGDAAAPVQAAPAAGDAPAWLHDMVEQVARLCAQGDPRFQHWSLTLPLDPQVLPDSELRLSLSPGAMALRFRTGTPQAAGLVCKYRDDLHARLAALPSSPPEIDIDLE